MQYTSVETEYADSESSFSSDANNFLSPHDLSRDVKLQFSQINDLIQRIASYPEEPECHEFINTIIKETKKRLHDAKKLAVDLRNNAINYSSLDNLQTLGLLPAQVLNNRFLNSSTSLNTSHHSVVSQQRNRGIPNLKTASQNACKLSAIRESEEEISRHQTSDFEDDSENVDENYLSAPESLPEESVPTFLLKNWSIKREMAKLFLIGTKLDRKGNLLEENFTSGRILNRSKDDIVRTRKTGNFILDEPLSDPLDLIPPKVKELFLKDASHFPKHWRKAVALWSDIDEAAEKKKKEKAKNTKYMQAKGPRKSKDRGNSSRDEDSVANKKAVSKKTKDKSPQEKSKKKTPEVERKPKKPISSSSPVKKSKAAEKSQEKKKELSQKNENKSTKQANKENVKSTNQSKNEKQKNDKEEIELYGHMDDAGLYFGMAGEQSPCIVQSQSMTPTAFLQSVQKATIRGRYTPPTCAFDNLYGKNTTPSTQGGDSIMGKDDSVLPDENVNLLKRIIKTKDAHPPKTTERRSPAALKPVDGNTKKLVDEYLKQKFYSDDEMDDSDGNESMF